VQAGDPARWLSELPGQPDGRARLRPLGPVELLDRSVDTFRQVFVSVVPVVAMVVVPIGVLRIVLERNEQLSVTTLGSSTPLPRGSGGLTVLIAGLGALVLPLIAGAVAPAALAELLGRRLSPQELRSAALRRLPVLVVVWILVHLLELFGFVGIGVGAVVVMTLCSVAAPVAAIERSGPVKAIKRSFALVRQRFWATLGRVILIAVFTEAVGIGLDLIPLTVESLVGHQAQLIVVGITSLGVSAVSATLAVIAATLIYVDLRVRLEGWDLALAIEAMAT
jgi:hypothetical protein